MLKTLIKGGMLRMLKMLLRMMIMMVLLRMMMRILMMPALSLCWEVGTYVHRRGGHLRGMYLNL